MENQKGSKSRKGKECGEGVSNPLARTTNMKNNETQPMKTASPLSERRKTSLLLLEEIYLPCIMFTLLIRAPLSVLVDRLLGIKIGHFNTPLIPAN